MDAAHTPGADTICAAATATGGALAVVRLSGPAARSILADLAPRLRPRPSHVLGRARLVDRDGDPLDDAMVVSMHGPGSFTGEDVVEIFLHGSPAVVGAVLAACEAAGARPARPGEFTLRAFGNGRLDLVQAEAVAALVAAEGDDERRRAIGQLGGGLSRRLEALAAYTEAAVAALRAALDFPLDDGGQDAWAAAAGRVREAAEVGARELAAVLAHGLAGAPGRPPQVVLTGPANAGKSTLANAWAGDERVLVDAAAGTTRDPVAVDIAAAAGVVGLRLMDTAGVGALVAGDPLARRAATLSKRAAAEATLALWLVPADRAAAGDDDAWPPPGWPPTTVVVSKADLVGEDAVAAVVAQARGQGTPPLAVVAAQAGQGVDTLAARVHQQLAPAAGGSMRLRLAVGDCLAHLQQATVHLAEAEAGGGWDLVLSAMEGAHAALGTALGRDLAPATVERVFADFCIGK